MEYFKLQLFSHGQVYGLRQYFPYTDKPFFNCLDDILEDESLQLSLANMFAQLYKDDLIFEYSNLDRHRYIVPIKHKSSKFTKINKLLCENVASCLGMEVLNDYFESFDVPFVDIRDEYTKDNNVVEVQINKSYKDTPVIIFDCCCSTGKIFDYVFKACNNSENLYLCYGFRFNAVDINNTAIKAIVESELSIEPYMEKVDGFFVRIYGLFGKKNVQVDFRDKFSICIGENGFGKTTAIKLSLLALEYIINQKSENPQDFIEDKAIYYLNLISRFYFKKIEIYYSGRLLKNNNGSSLLVDTLKYEDVIPSKRMLTGAINDKNVTSFLESLNSLEFETVIRKILLDDRSIEMDYKNLEMKNNALFDFNIIDKKLRRYLHHKNVVEMNDYISVSLSLDTNDFIYFNCAKSRYIISKPPRDRIKLDYFVNNENYDGFSEKDIILNDAYYNDNHSKEADIEEHSREKEEEELSYYKSYDPQAFDYDDPEDYNPYEDDYDDSYEDDYYDSMEDYEEDEEKDEYYDPSDEEVLFYNSLSEFGNDLFYSNIEYVYINSMNDYKKVAFRESEDNSFATDKIRIDKVLHGMLLFNELSNSDYCIETNVYSLLEQIIQYDKVDLANNKIFIELKYDYPNIELDIEKYLSDKNKDVINQYYYDIFNKDYNTIVFGVYDILNDSQFKSLSAIIKRLRTSGMKTQNDFIVVVGLKLLVDSYKKDFITSKNYLLEKLLNKYLIGKKACIYANSLTILDDDNNYIPIDRLSTGERDLIIMFCLCLFNNSKESRCIILDEPDLSMSVDWQSKILVDLMKYTSNNYIIISQSPLLVQNNDLSVFVKRLDFDEDIDIVEDAELKEEIVNHYSSNRLPF